MHPALQKLWVAAAFAEEGALALLLIFLREWVAEAVLISRKTDLASRRALAETFQEKCDRGTRPGTIKTLSKSTIVAN